MLFIFQIDFKIV